MADRDGRHAEAPSAHAAGAKAGDRTALDALLPAADAFNRTVGASLREASRKAVAAAEQVAAATATMRPRLDRAAYVGDWAVGAPDAGASAVLMWMRSIAEGTLPTTPSREDVATGAGGSFALRSGALGFARAMTYSH